MIDVLSRKLRVRDDGAGNPRDKLATFADFEHEDAIILLGDPGMGKSTLFREVSGNNLKSVRSFLIDHRVEKNQTLFLDALDEFRTDTDKDASFSIAKVLCALDRPKFRISCRAADWFGSVDQEAFREASSSGRVVILELCPLTREEIHNALELMGLDSRQFDEIESMGLGKLLENPQTLELLALAWKTNKKPKNKFEAFNLGIAELIIEKNDKHIPRGSKVPNTKDLRNAARAASSVLLLSNSVGIATTDPAEGSGFVKASIIPCSGGDALEAVLKRRVFKSPDVDRFEPVHRTIAEFLAAEDLSERIDKGLPIDRVMALICGFDGKPVSSLRGLFAWLVCMLKDRAEFYIARDPYGVVTYGDASVLSPKAQCAIWTSLRQLLDPWFLTNDDDRGTFRDLANPNTANILDDIFQDQSATNHLKIAALEAIANSTSSIGLDKYIQDIVLGKQYNWGLRSTALRAFARPVNNDWAKLKLLDDELAKSSDDPAAPRMRVDLLRITPACGNLAQRILAIFEQASSSIDQRHVFGTFASLTNIPSDSDLDEILDGISVLSIPKKHSQFELNSITERWLKRRIEYPMPIMPSQLCDWLRSFRDILRRGKDEINTSLKIRFEREPQFFEDVLDQLMTQDENQPFSHVIYDLFKILPQETWPTPPSVIFLDRAHKEGNPKRSAEFFSGYLSWFPLYGTYATLAEAGFDFLNRRCDVKKTLGKWNTERIPKWRKDEWKEIEKDGQRRKVNCLKNIAYFTSRLANLRDGKEIRGLAWAAIVYLGLYYDSIEKNPYERLTAVTNEVIAEAIIQGFIRYAENPFIPKSDEVLKCWIKNSIPDDHLLLVLSVCMRLNAGLSIPEEALPHCIAAVATELHIEKELDSKGETLSQWLVQMAQEYSSILLVVLKESWVASLQVKRGTLPGFYELNQDRRSHKFLAALSAEVLKAGTYDDHETIRSLVPVLLLHDRQAAFSIGEAKLTRNDLSLQVRAIWSTVLFLIDPGNYAASWKIVMSQSEDSVLWEAIRIIQNNYLENKEAIPLTSQQRADIVTALGRKFVKTSYPTQGWSGGQNPWDASDFIGNQIGLLAASASSDVETLLELLENDDGLASYRDLIRHQRAQYEKHRREIRFLFALPEEVAEAIQDGAPASPNDLLAFIVDHLKVLSYELVHTQRELHIKYWKGDKRNLINPKCEEDCSGFLAEDLLNRVRRCNLIVDVEHHMVKDKECDIVVMQGNERLLPIEVKHHYRPELWTAWNTQLDRLYTRDASAGGLGVYLVLWSGETRDRRMKKIPKGLKRPTNAEELSKALKSLIPEKDKSRLRVVVLDISGV